MHNKWTALRSFYPTNNPWSSTLFLYFIDPVLVTPQQPTLATTTTTTTISSGKSPERASLSSSVTACSKASSEKFPLVADAGGDGVGTGNIDNAGHGFSASESATSTHDQQKQQQQLELERVPWLYFPSYSLSYLGYPVSYALERSCDAALSLFQSVDRWWRPSTTSSPPSTEDEGAFGGDGGEQGGGGEGDDRKEEISEKILGGGGDGGSRKREEESVEKNILELGRGGGDSMDDGVDGRGGTDGEEDDGGGSTTVGEEIDQERSAAGQFPAAGQFVGGDKNEGPEAAAGESTETPGHHHHHRRRLYLEFYGPIVGVFSAMGFPGWIAEFLTLVATQLFPILAAAPLLRLSSRGVDSSGSAGVCVKAGVCRGVLLIDSWYWLCLFFSFFFGIVLALFYF